MAQQYLAAGLMDELQLHMVPVFLGAGERLFENPGAVALPRLECTSVIESPAVSHLRHRVLN